MFHPIRTSRASEDIVHQIKSLVFAGDLAPGDHLPSEMDLTEKFGVSRTTVRDALRVLESQGFIDIKVGAGGGAFVAKPSSELVSDSLSNMLRMQKTSIKELVEARIVVETAIVALAAKRATAADFKNIEQAITNARAGQLANDPHFTPHSVEFHVALAQAAKNLVLLFTVNSFRALFYDVLDKLLPAPDMQQRAIDDHQKILDAIKARDADKAQQIMRTHLSYFEARAEKLAAANDHSVPFISGNGHRATKAGRASRRNSKTAKSHIKKNP